ncbi:calcium/proton exchanger [Myriangium duriaei CBS 260.36]|uniref:Calcium/proton exchanger n=1 Tax=Myriangium duriaei CBS 260.36 TaxID=1168546 RepID=A0A9P4IZE1_9PEZI|nr:calcium/proton exchanger [Myriangium duriaei CBS 260.36]
MHSIKSVARREAWYSNDQQRNYNPFARGFKGRRIPDEEDSLSTSRSVDTVPSQIEADRLSRNIEDYPHPERAGTAPSHSAINGRNEIPNATRTGHTSEHPRYSSSDETARTRDLDASDSSPVGALEKTSDIDFAEPKSHVPVEDDTKSGPRHRRSNKHGTHEDEKDQAKDDTEDTKPKSRMAKWKKSKLTPWGEFKAVVFESWINVLLILVPVGFAINYAHLNGIANFVVNFIAIIPLAAMLSFATEELARYTNETIGGLLNASFGNATELIVSIIALKQQKVLIVQTSLIGSMLSNLLLVLGMCFFFGGITRVKQHFNITVAQTASSMLALSIGSLIIPTAFVRFGTQTNSDKTQKGAAPISRGTAVMLLLVYAAYLIFQLKTHTDMYNEPSKKGETRKSSKKPKGSVMHSIAKMGVATGASAGGSAMNQEKIEPKREEQDEDEEPTLSLIGALLTLTLATVAIAFCSEFMVTGINTVSKYISQEFIGLILLPIVGNAAEHATAVTVAIKDKMDLAIGVAVGSSMQIALLVLPLMVVIGWCGLGQSGPIQPAPDMNLDFDGFQVAVLFIAVLLVNYLIQDGESHWLEGVLLQATYIIIALTAYFYPTSGEVAG